MFLDEGSLDVKGLFKDGLVEKWELWLHAKHILKLTRSEQDPELSVEKRYDYLLAVGQMTEHSHSRKTIVFARTGLGFGIAKLALQLHGVMFRIYKYLYRRKKDKRWLCKESLGQR
jgi:hypothetical protein